MIGTLWKTVESLINLNITTFAWQIEVSIFKICNYAFTKGANLKCCKGKNTHIERVIVWIKDFRILNFH